jgi:hypothetical protein
MISPVHDPVEDEIEEQCANAEVQTGANIACGGCAWPDGGDVQSSQRDEVTALVPLAADNRCWPSLAARSEVTLGAKLQVDRVLVLELVPRGRLGRRRTENRRALEFLIEVDP